MWMPTNKYQFSICYLLQITLFVSLICATFVWFPILKVNRIGVGPIALFLLAGLFPSMVVSLMKHPFASSRFWHSTVVSFLLSSLGGLWVVCLICQAFAKLPNGIGMGMIYAVGIGMMTSVCIATFTAAFFPRHAVNGNDKDSVVFSLATNLTALAVFVCSLALIFTRFRVLSSIYVRTFGPEQFWLQALPYVLLATIAIAFRRTVSGAVISLFASIILSVFGIQLLYTANQIWLGPFLLILGCVVLLCAQMIRKELA